MVDGVDDCWHEGGAPNVGAMSSWSHPRKEYDTQPRPMPHLAVMTAAGLACLDCPATDPPHGYWTRTGEPPLVTVVPSLNISDEAWHGWLTNGVLTP